MKYTKRSTGKKAKIKQVPYKKVQSQRFALQELLKQFLLVYRYCTSIFLFHKKVQSQRFAMCTATVRAFSYSIKKRPLLFCERRSDRFFSVIDSCQNLCFINLFVLFFSNDTEFKNFVSLHTFLHTNQIRSPGYANRHTCCNYSKIILFDISFFLRLIHCMKK